MYSFGLLELFELCLLLNIATSATLDPLILPSLNSNGVSNSSNNSVGVLDYHSPRYHCDPKGYPEANERSCQNAANRIDGSRTRLTFVQRDSGGPGISLPYNWISGMY